MRPCKRSWVLGPSDILPLFRRRHDAIDEYRNADNQDHPEEIETHQSVQPFRAVPLALLKLGFRIVVDYFHENLFEKKCRGLICRKD